MADGEETFLKRWSRKKRLDAEAPVGVDTGSEEARPQEEAPARAQCGGDAGEKASGAADPLDLDSLPKLDDLTPASDVKGFMDPRVPAALRDAALKRVWTLDPAIRDFIEVAENQWDWNTPGGAPGYAPLEDANVVARLLDHAVGSIMGPRQEDPVILSSDVSTLRQSQGDDAALHKTPSSPIEPDKASSAVVKGDSYPTATSDALPQNAEHGNLPSGLRQRRHGGALPT